MIIKIWHFTPRRISDFAIFSSAYGQTTVLLNKCIFYFNWLTFSNFLFIVRIGSTFIVEIYAISYKECSGHPCSNSNSGFIYLQHFNQDLNFNAKFISQRVLLWATQKKKQIVSFSEKKTSAKKNCCHICAYVKYTYPKFIKKFNNATIDKKASEN